MKTRTTTMAIVASFIVSVHGQGFLNLDFESAQNLPENPGGGVLVAVTSALPGWTAYDGGAALSDIYYVSNSLGDVSDSVELEGGTLALSGNFSAALFTGGAISQTGLVPQNAESLEFEAGGPGAGGFLGASGLSVTLGGQTLSYSILSEAANYDVYGANIPAGLDGQMEALNFFVQNVTPGVLLDNIEFSPMSVPEPSEWAMIGVGTFLFCVRRPTPAR